MKKSLLIIAAAIVLAGCAKTASLQSLYLLDSPRLTRDMSSLNGKSIYVDKFQAAQAFDTKKFVYKTGENQFEADNYREFLVPCAEMAQRECADWLETCGVVLTASRLNADYTVKGFVNEFYADVSKPERSCVVSVRFFVFKKDGSAVDTFTVRQTAPLAENTPDGLVDSYNKCLAQVYAGFERRLARGISARES